MGKQAKDTTGVDEDHITFAGEVASPDQLHQTVECLACVDRVENEPFLPRCVLDRAVNRILRYTIARANEVRIDEYRPLVRLAVEPVAALPAIQVASNLALEPGFAVADR